MPKYPRHPCITGGRFPVGSCLARWSGTPACQIFYPADASVRDQETSGTFFRPELVENIAKNKLKGWVPAGLLKFLSRSGPYHQDAPVETGHGRFPVIIFSHGLFGTLDMYKTLCGGLAASGFVVVALEHEDHTAMYSVDEAGNAVEYRGAPEGFQFSRDNVIEFRKPYIAKRLDEMKKTMQAMADKATGLNNPTLVESILTQADLEVLFLAGHSFGSAACMVALEEIPGVKGCLLTDAWSFPVPRTIEEKGLHSCPLMFINSEVFAKGTEIGITQQIADNSSAAVGPVWIAGTAHQSFSDTPCLLPNFLGSKLGFSGASIPDEVHQAMLDSARAFFDHCCKSGDMKDTAQLQSLEETVLVHPLVNKLSDDQSKMKNAS